MGPGGPRVRPEDRTRPRDARETGVLDTRAMWRDRRASRANRGSSGLERRPHLRVARLRRHGFCYFSCHIGVKRPTRFAFPFRAAGKRPASSARLTSSPVPLLRRRDGRVHEGPVQAGRGRALGTSRDRPPRETQRELFPLSRRASTRLFFPREPRLSGTNASASPGEKKGVFQPPAPAPPTTLMG